MGQSASFEFDRDSSCAARARHAVRSTLGGKLPDIALERALLTASELVTNACKHGEGAIVLRLAHLRDRVRLEVIDAGLGKTPRIRDRADEDGGWGLRIVDQLALGWGCLEGTTHVWADLAVD
ncbi:MAG TPA: ATP-binding protein [Solirubrobacteraceae bacterium]|nr:ATP-binding protein [Solirubrobacteraceae bacterium]